MNPEEEVLEGDDKETIWGWIDIKSSSKGPFRSGLGLEISEGLFQLCMMLWTHQDPSGDMEGSVIIYFTAVMGIHPRSLAFRSPHESTPLLAGLVWVGRLLFLECALPVNAYNTLVYPWQAQSEYPCQTERLKAIRTRYMVRGCDSPLGEIMKKRWNLNWLQRLLPNTGMYLRLMRPFIVLLYGFIRLLHLHG